MISQDKPGAQDLLATSREALKTLLSETAVDERQRYTLLMAIRALGICSREFAQPNDEIAQLTDQIVQSGVVSGTTAVAVSTSAPTDSMRYSDFVRRVRNGAFDSDQVVLHEQLMQLVRCKLKISNPRFEQSYDNCEIN